eukprot:TRINITY_DN11180_c0_g2_i1.p1 TRINITY_DN11180_c0_g2~~TRINITY_DN11180_c0_g2_i1.p1  ORF type:complete len:712 (+),score=173.40 TRINITY_DN11180_c0_g2_i1:169-2136(+)
MDACTSHRLCEAVVWYGSGTYAGLCALLPEQYDSYHTATEGAYVANRPLTTGGLATCADSSAAVTCCVATFVCSSTSTTAISSSSVSSAAACAAACVAQGSCSSVVYKSDGTCSLYSTARTAADWTHATDAWAANMPSGVASACSSSSLWSLVAPAAASSAGGSGCTACTQAATPVCGRSPAPRLQLGLSATSGVASASACMALCTEHPACRATEYRYRRTGGPAAAVCQLLLRTPDASTDDADDGVSRRDDEADADWWSAARPFASAGSLATCVTMAEGPTCGSPCGHGWLLGPGDGMCYKLHSSWSADSDLHGEAAHPGASPGAAARPGETWEAARRVCGGYAPAAELAAPTNETQDMWLVRLLGPSQAAWLGVAETSPRQNESEWTLPSGRAAEYLPWEEMPPGGGCAALYTRAAPGEGGGLNLWRPEPCGLQLPFVCSRPLRPVQVLSVHGVDAPWPGPPPGVLPSQGVLPPAEGINLTPHAEVVELEQNDIVVTGTNFHSQLWVSLQTTSEATHATAPGQPTGCDGRLPLTDAAQPFVLEPLDNFTAGLRSDFPLWRHSSDTIAYNATDRAVFSIPRFWPLVVGYNYSVCWAEGVPYPEPADPRQYKNDAGVFLTVVREYHRRKRDVCDRRNERVEAVYRAPPPVAERRA